MAVASTRPDRDWPTLRRLLPWLRTRCPSAAAVLRVPRGVDPEIVHLASRAGSLHVRAVLVEGEGIASALRELLTNPTDLAGEVVDWLPIRGVRPSPKSARCIHHIFEGTPKYKTIGSLLRQLPEHPRTVRSWFRTDGLPTPSHWHAAARAVHACLRLQRDRDRPLHRLALEAGYCDYSHLSRQVTRLFGISPVVVRDALGWEWLLDRWLGRESARGSRPVGAQHPRRG